MIRNTLRGRLQVETGRAKLGGMEAVLDKLSAINRLTIVGCGSAYYAGAVGRYMLEEYANLPVEVEIGSEYRYKKQLPDMNSAVLAITQSGETADTLASIRLSKQLGLLSMGMVNVVGSTIARRSEEHRLNSSHDQISYAVFCLKKKKQKKKKKKNNCLVHV